MRFYILILILIQLITLSLSAQLITQKNGKYGITNIISGELMVEQKYDTIYQLGLRPRGFYDNQDKLSIPIFVCKSNKQLELYNSNNASFYKGNFEEIKFYRQLNEQSFGLNPPKYIPYWVDCFMLKKGNNWGYISYKKEYSFHEQLEKTDSFKIIEPQYLDLKFVEEEYGYDSKKYTRKRRIVAAKKDSLWGAVSFETGEVIVPFIYNLPIHSFYNSYDSHGLEFFSVEGGFIPYYIGRKTWDNIPQIVINPKHPDIWFEFDFPIHVNIYNEFGNQYLYIEPKKGKEGFFNLYDFNTGKQLLSYKRDLSFEHFRTYRKIENILVIDESTPHQKLFRQTWFNLTTGKVILYAEGESYKDTDFILSQNSGLTLLKGAKTVGKIVGEGADMTIEWTTKKSYTKEMFK